MTSTRVRLRPHSGFPSMFLDEVGPDVLISWIWSCQPSHLDLWFQKRWEPHWMARLRRCAYILDSFHARKVVNNAIVEQKSKAKDPGSSNGKRNFQWVDNFWKALPRRKSYATKLVTEVPFMVFSQVAFSFRLHMQSRCLRDEETLAQLLVSHCKNLVTSHWFPVNDYKVDTFPWDMNVYELRAS